MTPQYLQGVADVLADSGFTKEAGEVYLGLLIPTTEKFAMEGANPFESMSDQEIVALIQQLPPPVQAEVMKQLQEHATQAAPPVAG